MDIEIGDIVLVELQFTHFKDSKKRPVLVLKDNMPFNDFFGLAITSLKSSSELRKNEYALDNQSLKSGQLPSKSKIIISKPFTISKDIIIKKYGQILNESLQEIKERFCQYYEC